MKGPPDDETETASMGEGPLLCDASENSDVPAAPTEAPTAVGFSGAESETMLGHWAPVPLFGDGAHGRELFYGLQAHQELCMWDEVDESMFTSGTMTVDYPDGIPDDAELPDDYCWPPPPNVSQTAILTITLSARAAGGPGPGGPQPRFLVWRGIPLRYQGEAPPAGAVDAEAQDAATTRAWK